MRQEFLLRLTIESPIEVPLDVVESVVDFSTAREAIADGLWAWLPRPVDEEFSVSLTVVSDE